MVPPSKSRHRGQGANSVMVMAPGCAAQRRRVRRSAGFAAALGVGLAAWSQSQSVGSRLPLAGRREGPPSLALVQHIDANPSPVQATSGHGADHGLLGIVLQDIYRASFGPLLAVTAALAWHTRPRAGTALPPGFTSFQCQYLMVWALAICADWLQGPYVYALYASYGYAPSEIARLFVAGFGSSMICGTFIGAVADAWGRRRCAVLYCLLYISACLTKHSRNHSLLMLGRVLGGAATSLLFSTFECWMVAEHRKRGFSEALLRYGFGLMFFVQYLTAIAAGIMAQMAVSASPLRPVPGMSGLFYGGYTAPFDLSLTLLLLALVAIVTQWSENYGEQEAKEQGLVSSLQSACRAFSTSWRVAVLGVAVAAFEGSMYAFVFNWTPALATGVGSPPPHGLIFSAFMMACMCGSSLFSLVDASQRPARVLLPICLASALSLAIVTFWLGRTGGTPMVFAGFLAFETCVGAYFPAAGTLKSEVVPENARAGIYNIYRVPLNAVVILLLLTNIPLRMSFGICCGLLAIAVAAVRLLLLPQAKQ